MEWSSCLEILCSTLGKKGLHNKKFKSERELMSYVLINSDVRKIIFLWLKEHENKQQCKSSAMAHDYKEIGNNEFKRKQYFQSVASYTNSVRYAPKGSAELAIAIANRSASLFYLNRYNDCIEDIDVAITLGYPTALQYKLLVRKAQCYVRLENHNATQEVITQLKTLLDNSKDITDSVKGDIKKKIMDLFSNKETGAQCFTPKSFCEIQPDVTYGKNVEFPYASAGIDRVCNAQLGKYVVANRNIKKGDILFVENPMAFVLIGQERSNDICHNCCKSCRNIPVPCAECINTCYCGIDCANTAWSSYHCWECAGHQMNIWCDVGIAHLALKVLLICTTTTNTVMFNEMQNLVTNFDNLSTGDLIIYSITAAMLTLYLSEYTDYFKVTNFEECLTRKFNNSISNIPIDNNKELYISSLLLHHILQLISNGHAISKLNSNADNGKVGFVKEQDIVATGIYPSASIMNHSCNPSIINIFMNEVLIVRAAKDIAKGEQVFNCYGPHYRRLTTSERRKLLKSQYCFPCQCDACTLPKLKFFVEKFSGIRCPRCDNAMCVTDSSFKSRLNCIDCNFIVSDEQYKCKIQKASEICHSAQRLLDSGKAFEALNELKKCLNMRQEVLYKFHDDIILTLDFMGEAYALLGQWLSAISCQERIIPAIVEKYGSTSIELATELNKVVDVCDAYLRTESNANNRSNVNAKIQSYLDQIMEILDFNYGSWSREYNTIKEKKEEHLNSLLKDCHI